MTAQAADIVVVGGGIIGCGIAYELAGAGASVTLIERGAVGREASGAAIGLVRPPGSATINPARAELTAESVKAFPAYVEEIEAATGIDVGFRVRGELRIARDEDELRLLEPLIPFLERLGFPSRWVDRATARDLEPVVPEQTVSAVLVEETSSVNNARLTQAIAVAARRRGVRLIEHAPVSEVLRDGERVTGVRTPGERFPAGSVVLAAGAWTGELGTQLGARLPTMPVRGQYLSLRNPPIDPRMVVSLAHHGHLIPHADGTVGIGTTAYQQGFDGRVIAADSHYCLELAREIGQRLLEGEVVGSVAGLRPGSIDEQMIVGLVPGYQGLWVATGHHQNGIQLAPITAKLVARAMLYGESDARLANFSPDRFA